MSKIRLAGTRNKELTRVTLCNLNKKDSDSNYDEDFLLDILSIDWETTIDTNDANKSFNDFFMK